MFETIICEQIKNIKNNINLMSFARQYWMPWNMDIKSTYTNTCPMH